jgi:hypothetical protein
MAISDTSPEIAEMQMQIRRRMTMNDRFRIAIELSDLCQELRKAGIKREHPDWSERDVLMELFRLAFFPEPLPSWVR